MSKKDEALKLALEALDCIYSPLHVREINKVGAAMAAIREALAEQPAQQWTDETAKVPDHVWDEKCVLGHCGWPSGRADSERCRADNTPAQQEPARVPVTDNTYNYAKSLAEAIFKQHFASDEHYASGRIVWGVNDTVIGILTQIDNMVSDMVRRPAQQGENK